VTAQRNTLRVPRTLHKERGHAGVPTLTAVKEGAPETKPEAQAKLSTETKPEAQAKLSTAASVAIARDGADVRDAAHGAAGGESRGCVAADLEGGGAVAARGVAAVTKLSHSAQPAAATQGSCDGSGRAAAPPSTAGSSSPRAVSVAGGEARPGGGGSNFERGADGKIRAHGQVEWHVGDTERLVFFERMFFLLDADAKGYVSLEEAKHFLSFTALDLQPDERSEAVERADFVRDGRLVRYEFIEMCADLLWATPLTQLQLAVENFKDAQQMYLTRNLSAWRAASRRVDRRARFYLPLAFLVSHVVLWNLDMRDRYHASLASNAKRGDGRMFEGMGELYMTPGGIAWSIVVPLLCLVTVLALHAGRKYARRTRLLDDGKDMDSSQQKERSTPFSGVRPQELQRDSWAARRSQARSCQIQPFVSPTSGLAGCTVQELNRMQRLSMGASCAPYAMGSLQRQMSVESGWGRSSGMDIGGVTRPRIASRI